VSEDIGNRYQFNTAIAAVMELVNAVYLLKDELIRSPQGREILSSAMATVLTLLFPVTPHLCEELWQELGHAEPLARQSWPEWKEDALRRDVVTMVIQINGKLRGRMDVPAGTPDEEVKRAALAEPAVARHLERENLTVRRVVVVPGRLVNVVAG
jgi:leucyl-tRNA synthetase